MSIAETKKLSQHDIEYLREAWDRKEKRSYAILGHAFACLINRVCGMMLGKDYDPITWRDIYEVAEDLDESDDQNDDQEITSGSAAMLAFFKTEEIKHNKKQLQDALMRIELHKNG